MEQNTTYNWICPECGQEVISDRKPAPIRWTDGHVCEAWQIDDRDPDDFSDRDPLQFR